MPFSSHPRPGSSFQGEQGEVRTWRAGTETQSKHRGEISTHPLTRAPESPIPACFGASSPSCAERHIHFQAFLLIMCSIAPHHFAIQHSRHNMVTPSKIPSCATSAEKIFQARESCSHIGLYAADQALLIPFMNCVRATPSIVTIKISRNITARNRRA